MKLSKLIETLQTVQSNWKIDPDVCVRTPDFEDRDIEDFCSTISSDREDPYLVILGFNEETYFNEFDNIEFASMPWYENLWNKIKNLFS